MKADVVIAGAGVSGVPAAIAAARAGAQTLLIETAARIGGTMMNSLGFPVCGLFENDRSEPRLLNEGLSKEFFEAVCAEVLHPVSRMGRVSICRCPVTLFESIYTRWITAKNLTLCLGVTDLFVDGNAGRIERVRFQTLERTVQTVEVSQVVDCTGTGEVIKKCDAKQIVPATLPLAGFSVRIEGVQADDLLPVKVPYVLRQAVDAGELPRTCAFTGFSPLRDGQALCKFSLPDGIRPVEAGKVARKALRILQENIQALSTSKAVVFSPAVLHREGSRLLGEYVLSKEDVLGGKRFDDCAAHGAWPVEYWNPQSGVQYEYVEAESYDIPLRALRSATIENLWAAGRLLSADSCALASVRVMGTSIATGEAAGMAAVKELG